MNHPSKRLALKLAAAALAAAALAACGKKEEAAPQSAEQLAGSPAFAASAPASR